MTVTVQAGFAICGSCLKLEEVARTLAVQASDANYDRIDSVVLRLNTNDNARYCDLYVVQGIPSTSPVRPTLTRTSTIWELGLAVIFIAKNSGAISAARITDTRYDATRCGVISSISEFDTTTIYNQVQADLAEFKAEEQADFLAWYEQMRNQLSEDVAGNLQAQIDTMKGSILDTMSEINANTQDNQLAGALAVKELKNSIYDSERIEFTPSDAGWWRVAKMSNANANYARGALCSGCEIDIRRTYNTLDNEYHRVSLVFNYCNAEFVNETSKCNFKIINHIRLTHDTTNNDIYIEIWYDQKLTNNITITLSQHINTFGQKWTPITPVATSDSTEGVNVLALHSFLDNCEFATNLDLDKIKNQLGEIKFKFISMTYETDGASFELCIKNNWSSLDVGFYVLKVNVGPEAIAFVQKTNELYGTVIYFNYGGALRVLIIANGTWHGENEIITETILEQELANYLPQCGGELKNNLTIRGDAPTCHVANGDRSVCMHVDTAGTAGMYDSTHGMWLFRSNKDGCDVDFPGKLTRAGSKVLTSADFVVTGSASEATLTINLG